jgi:lipopolysaccharide transport system permease protein
MNEIIIHPSSSWFRIPWRDILEYRDLLFLLVRRDFVARYKQTLLGPAWFVIQPLTTTLVFTVVFSKIAKIPTDKLPPLLFYLCGMIAWQYFAQSMQGTSTTFTSNAGLFGKVYFPRLVVPLSVIISNLASFAIQLGTFLCFWCFYKFCTASGGLFRMTPWLLVIPVLLLQTAAIALGVGLWMSALSAKYRDFSYASGFLTQIWFYATPVVYPLSEVPERWRWVSAINPMSSIVEAYRYAFLGSGTVSPLYLGISAVTTVILLITGIVIFGRTERTFIDTV